MLVNFRKLSQYPASFLFASAGFVFFVIACYPGFMSPDSLEQYKQAHTLQFADGHPPVMAWLWAKLNFLFNGPQGMLFFHLAMLWTGLYIWRRNAGQSDRAKWFIIVGFLPWVVTFEGVLWKDVGMAFSLLLAIGLLSSSKLTKLEIVGSVCLLIYAFMVRSNAPAAVLPVIFYVFIRILPLVKTWVNVLLTMLSLLIIFSFANIFNYSVLDAKKDNLASFMMIDDLVHLSVIAEKSLLPRVDFDTLLDCSQTVVGDTTYVGRLFCLGNKTSYQSVAPIPFEELKKAWVSAVKIYPIEVVQFRLNAYLNLLRSPTKSPYIYTFSAVYPNEFGIVQSSNTATVLLQSYVKVAVNITPFLFKPYWWIVVASLFLCVTFLMRGEKESITLIRVLLFSALLYMLSYLPLAPMADFRYIYWSTLAISLAAVKFFTSNLKIQIKNTKEV